MSTGIDFRNAWDDREHDRLRIHRRHRERGRSRSQLRSRTLERRADCQRQQETRDLIRDAIRLGIQMRIDRGRSRCKEDDRAGEIAFPVKFRGSHIGPQNQNHRFLAVAAR